MTTLQRKFGFLALISALFSIAIAGEAESAIRTIPSYNQLGHGHFPAMYWEARGEVSTNKGEGASVEEACITISILERREGNESSNCGPANAGVEQSARSPYGVIAAAMYPPDAKRAVLCEKGGKEVVVPLKPLRLRVGASRPIRSFSAFARGFPAGTRIKWMIALDGHGNALGAGSSIRRCH